MKALMHWLLAKDKHGDSRLSLAIFVATYVVMLLVLAYMREICAWIAM